MEVNVLFAEIGKFLNLIQLKCRQEVEIGVSFNNNLWNCRWRIQVFIHLLLWIGV